jgi:hypothetical protein
VQSTGVLRNSSYKEELPAVILKPKRASGRTVIWTTETGKAGLFASDTADAPEPKPAIQKLLETGAIVVGVDLLYQGEFLTNTFSKTPRVKNPRESAAFTFGYNHPVFAQRVHDLLSVIRYCQEQETPPQRIDLAGLDATGPLVAAARAQAGTAIHKTVVQTGGFRFIQVMDLHDPAFLPGAAKYGDLPGFLALAAPGKLWVSGEGSAAPDLLQKLYASPSVQANLVTDDSPPAEVAEAAVTWLLAKD